MTLALLLAGILQVGGAWEIVDDFQARRYSWDVAYSLNPERAVRFYRDHHRTIAPREVWSCGVILDWRESSATSLLRASQAWERLKPWLRERLDTQRAPPPELTCGEVGVFYWAAGIWGRPGGFRLGTLNAVKTWPHAVAPGYLWLFRQWHAAGGGRVVLPPYLFTSVSSQSPTWFAVARASEPLLFGDGPAQWPPSFSNPDVDHPSPRAWRVARKALERWMLKLKRDLGVIPFRVVAQVSNGVYSGGSAWLNLAVRDLPAITPDIQVELLANGYPAFPCQLVRSLQAANANVSVWSYTLALGLESEISTCLPLGTPRP